MEIGLYTLSVLHEKMRSTVGDNTPVYHERYLKESLQKNYGNSILFTNQECRKNVACFSSCVSKSSETIISQQEIMMRIRREPLLEQQLHLLQMISNV